MIIRSALLLGTVAPEKQAAFDAHMRTTVVAQIRKYPHILDVILRKTCELEDGAPQVYMQFDLHFASLNDMNAALASPIRDAVRADIVVGMADFQGSSVHVVSEQYD